MDAPLRVYKEFVDGLVMPPSGHYERLVLRDGWAREWNADELRPLLGALSDEQKKVLVHLLREAEETGMFAAVRYLEKRIALDGFRMRRGEVEMAVHPFGSEIYHDWLSRKQGEPWPDDDEKA